MMMKGRLAEQPVRLRVFDAVARLAVLEHQSLEDHRRVLGRKHAADEEQQELRLEQDGDGAQGTAKCECARVAHEHLGGMRVKPEETGACTDKREAEDRQLTRTRQV